MPGTVDTFADTGIVAYEDGVLPDALDELADRLERIGAGPLIDEWATKRAQRQRLRRLWRGER